MPRNNIYDKNNPRVHISTRKLTLDTLRDILPDEKSDHKRLVKLLKDVEK